MAVAAQQIPDVRKSVDVATTPEHLFSLFTERPLTWFPPTHVLLERERAGMCFEPRAGGRWYEWDVAGTEVDWGRILCWEPPHLLRTTWRVGPRFTPMPDDELASEIEITCTPLGDGRTRTELAHLKLYRHGPAAEGIYGHLVGPSPGETLARFAAAARAELAR